MVLSTSSTLPVLSSYAEILGLWLGSFRTIPVSISTAESLPSSNFTGLRQIPLEGGSTSKLESI